MRDLSLLRVKEYKNHYEMRVDERKLVAVLLAWQVISLIVLLSTGSETSQFLRIGFGPDASLSFLNFQINSWSRWGIFMAFCWIDTIINTAGNRILYPWITNTVMDEFNLNLPYSKQECFWITNLYYFYSSIRGIILILLVFTQIDFMIGKIIADSVVQMIISHYYLEAKNYRIGMSQLHSNSSEEYFTM